MWSGWVNQKERCRKQPHKIPLFYKLIGSIILNIEQWYPTWVNNAPPTHGGIKWNSLYQVLIICLGLTS